MNNARVYRGRYVELLLGVGLGGQPLSPMELMGYAKSGLRRELLSCGGVPPDSVRKLPESDLSRIHNPDERLMSIMYALRSYNDAPRRLLFDAHLAYVWICRADRLDFDAAAMEYLSGAFELLPRTRIVASEIGVAWVDPVAVDAAMFIPHTMLNRVGADRDTRRPKGVGSGTWDRPA